ncbi:hypothetical protein FRC07_010934 [Ceratobasidium sp. 392]|nr:hypothetical protein FRC07_010934 [Ceratobasidium sp. 392]
MPASRASKLAHVSSKKLGNLARHTPYPTPEASVSLRKKSTRAAKAKAKVQAEAAATSNVSERQVEATLAPAPLSQASTEYFSAASALSRASTLTGMSSFSGMSSLSGISRTFSGFPVTSTLAGLPTLAHKDSLDIYRSQIASKKSLGHFSYRQPLSRQSSTTSTVLELPDGPGEEYSSYGTPEDIDTLTPKASMDLAGWAAGKSAWAHRSSSPGLSTDDDDSKVSAVNHPVRMPLPYLSFSSCESKATEVDIQYLN